jgi:hypothetical protein
MSTEEKLRAMEIIWDDLCKKAGSLSSPCWHSQILHEKEGMLKEGNDEFVDWDKAKNHIRRSTQ